MNPLVAFYSDEVTRDAFKEFQLELLREMAAERVFAKQTVAGIYEAQRIITKSFERLEELYGVKDKPEPQSSR